jgi:hypothetical protein
MTATTTADVTAANAAVPLVDGRQESDRRKAAALELLRCRREVYVRRGQRALLSTLLDGAPTATTMFAGLLSCRPASTRNVLAPCRQDSATPPNDNADGCRRRRCDSRRFTNSKGTQMGKLSDILRNGSGDSLRRAWETTEAAGDFASLPAGHYVARITAGELFTAKTNGTAGYKLAFRVLEGDYVGRKCWYDIWLTEAALPMAKRDLAKLGVTDLEQLERPLPKGIRAKAHVTLRKADDGTEFNRVKSFEVIGIDPPDNDTFAPTDPPPPANDAGGTDASPPAF